MLASEFIKSRRIELELTQKDIADALGVSEGTVSRWESGDINNMRRDRIFRLAQILKVPAVDLLQDEIDPSASLSMPTPSNILPLPRTRKIPLLGSIACGEPLLAEENLDGEVDLPEHINADFALRCKGDSMINARIFDGDIVYIRRTPNVENGKIAAVRIGEEATLKKVYYFPEESRLVLRPCNPLYSDLVYSGPDLENVEIIGEAVAFTSLVRHE